MPEPWNPHDPNAVAIMVRTFHVRHLPAGLARRYHGSRSVFLRPPSSDRFGGS